MEILIHTTPDAASAVGAGIVAQKVRQKPSAVLGLATGRTPILLYRRLVELHRQGQLDFRRVVTFNLDEYVGLEPGHPRSYYTFMQEHFFTQVDIDPDNTHIPNGCDPHLRTACRRYERQIKDAGGIDLQLLGLGTNGHIGFNEPTGSLASRTWIKVLSRQTMADNAAEFGSIEAVPTHVVTMGIGTILESRHCLLMAFGEAKAAAVQAMVEGPVTSMCPASALQFHPRATVLLDDASASRLASREHYKWVESQKLAWQRYDSE